MEPVTLLSAGEAARLLNISTGTLRNWEKLGKIQSKRTGGNHRRYYYTSLLPYMPEEDMETPPITTKRIVVCKECNALLFKELITSTNKIQTIKRLYKNGIPLLIMESINSNRKSFKIKIKCTACSLVQVVI